MSGSNEMNIRKNDSYFYFLLIWNMYKTFVPFSKFSGYFNASISEIPA